MRHTNWRPFIMFGLMIGCMLVIGLSIFILAFFRTGAVGSELTYGNWWSGIGGMGPFMLVFPCLGFGMMILMMFFFRGMGRRDGSMGRGGPMDWMWGSDPEKSGRRSSPSKIDLLCPQCDDSVLLDWNVCPQCGASLK